MESLNFHLRFDHLWNCMENTRLFHKVRDNFAAHRNNVDRCKCAFKTVHLFEKMPVEDGARELVGKSARKSEIWGGMAGKTLSTCNDKYDKALVQYNRSVACAPYPTSMQNPAKELATAYYNRSLVLLNMNKPEACLSDIQRALDFNFEQNCQYELYARKGKCFQRMGEIEQANASFQKAVELLPTTPLPPDAVSDMMSEMLPDSSQLTKPAKVSSALPAVAYEPHDTVPSASSCVDLASSPGMGQCIKANRDIQHGDVLIVEDPYASVLLPKFYYTHCYKCLQRSYSLIPCKRCSQAMYCSEECRDTSWSNVHLLECGLLPNLLELDMGLDWLLALKITLIAVKKVIMTHGTTTLPQSDIDMKKSVKFLQQHRNDRSLKTSFKMATVAVLVTTALFDKMNRPIPVEGDAANSGTELFYSVAALLLQSLHNLPCNSYLVTDLELNENAILKTKTFGMALYATAAKMNHSCCANTIRSYHKGAGLSVIAIQPIKKGEQIFCNYGVPFNQYVLEYRQTHLQAKYFFSCNCNACIKNWPQDFARLSPIPHTFLCLECSAPLPNDNNSREYIWCERCGSRQGLAVLKITLRDIAETMVKMKALILSGSYNDFAQDKQNLLKMLKSLNKVVKRPNKAFDDVVEALRLNAMKAGGNLYLVK